MSRSTASARSREVRTPPEPVDAASEYPIERPAVVTSARKTGAASMVVNDHVARTGRSASTKDVVRGTQGEDELAQVKEEFESVFDREAYDAYSVMARASSTNDNLSARLSVENAPDQGRLSRLSWDVDYRSPSPNQLQTPKSKKKSPSKQLSAKRSPRWGMSPVVSSVPSLVRQRLKKAQLSLAALRK